MPFFGREMACVVAGEIGDGRFCAVRRFTCASSLLRCLRRSSSLSFTENASSMNASGVAGRVLGGGWYKMSEIASAEVDWRRIRRVHEKRARPARNRNVTPVSARQRTRTRVARHEDDAPSNKNTSHRRTR